MKDLSEIIYVLMREVGLHLNQAIGILELFFSNHAETERLLGICVKHKDFAAIQKQAHQLKGTTANLRMSCISDIASSLETAAKEFDIGLCEKYIIDLSEQIVILELQIAPYKRTHQLKILIVEDNIASGKILEQIIINLGHQSLGIVSTPEQALLSVKNTLPGLVFMDIDLSTQMNGIYTAELISDYHSVPVVFVSIHANEDIIKAAKNYGIGYVVKPFTPKEIEEMIELAVENTIKLQRVDKTHQIKLRVKDDNRIFFIDLYDVIFIESRKHTVMINTARKTYKLNDSLKNIKALDKKGYFVQPHRSFLVNRAYVAELINENYNYFLKLEFLSERIPVSNNNVKTIKTIL